MNRWVFAPLLLAAVAGPPLLMQDDNKQNRPEEIAIKAGAAPLNYGQFSPQADFDPAIAQNQSDHLHADELQMLDPTSIAYAPGARDFREVFRFDANPQWLQKNWPRVSVVASMDGLEGYRVPLVTGPNHDDLTGSLTYYFDRSYRCQRISFNGFVVDPTRVIHAMTNAFQMRREPRLGADIYINTNAQNIKSLLMLNTQTAIYANKSKQPRKMIVELNNPQGKSFLSPENQRIIQQAAKMHSP